MNHRVYNFSAGPSMLPEEVLKAVQADLANYKNSGMSVMEMSHRSKVFDKIISDAENDLRSLMNIPPEYKVLFLQGGATLQFSAIPINLLKKSKKADYIVTGSWAAKAAKEAEKFGDIRIVASSKEDNYTYIPNVNKEDFRKDADYVHITFNNTIYGTKYPYVPDTGDIPLVCDMSSSILSEKIDVTKFDMIYAGAQKNIGPAGLTLIIIKESLIGFAPKDTPVYLDYKTHADNDSLYNTPPAFGIYVAGEVFKHLLDRGGVKAQEVINKRKADKLYSFIDNSRLYKAPARIEDRSPMNVVFVTGNPDLDKKFVADAREAGLYELAGHRSIGGMRASIYNAMPEKGVEALIDFMKAFEEEVI
jgi:phosphoserine aminotransferase